MLIKDSRWCDALANELHSDEFLSLLQFIEEQRAQGKNIYPCESDVFSALNLTPLDAVKVVILGQDPYHGAGQAHGLSFSVREGVAIPPSLKNIYKEIVSDVFDGDRGIPESGCLTHWAQQGVLLLNAVLTVEEAKPNSHQGRGWEVFTDAVIRAVNNECEGVVFLLWGAYAKKKAALIDETKHHVLMSAHPSPLSAYRGFLGCGHFSQVNRLLAEQREPEIKWFCDAGAKSGASKRQFDLL